MAMHPSKASKLMRDYAKNGFNAKKTLLENGYSEMTADKDAKNTIRRAERVVKEQLQLDKDLTTKETAQTSLDILGVTREEVAEQLKEIAFNKKDYGNALKVLAMLARDMNLDLLSEEKQVAPQLNVTVEKVENTAQQSPEIHPEDI